MALATVRRRAVNPIVYNFKKVIGECNAFGRGVASYVGSSVSSVGECVPNTSGFLLNLGTPDQAIGEVITAPVFSNIQFGIPVQSIGECATPEAILGGSIDIYDEGILVQSKVTCLDFIGADILAKTSSTGGTCVEVYSPAPSYVSHWNTSDGTNVATVADVATASRWVATPSGGEGIPFYTNAWAGAQHPTTRTSPLTWATANECSFVSTSTTFNILITNGNAPADTVVNFTTGSITGDGVYAGSNCTITITNWVAESDKYSADVSVAVDIATLFPTGGYFDITISHINGADGTFTKTQ